MSSKPIAADSPSAGRKARSRSRIAAFFVILLGCGAALYLFWFWRQSARPGVVHYLRGLDLLAANRPKDAEYEWTLGIREDKSAWQCYEQLGDLYMTIHHAPEAAACFAAATGIVPADGRMWFKLARAARNAGRVKEALDPARKAAELLPNDADVVGNWGVLEGENKNRAIAAKALRRAHELKPDDRRLLLAMVNAELDNLDMASAERDLMPFVATHPKDAEAAYLAALIYNQKPRSPENLKSALQYAVTAFPPMKSDPQIYSLLGQLYLDSGEAHEALHVFLAGFQIAPHSLSVLHGLVDSYTRVGDGAQAKKAAVLLADASAKKDRIEHLKHVMGFNHLDTSAGLELARLQEESGERKKALEYFQQLVRQAPADPRTRKALSAYYSREGRTDLAAEALKPDYMP